MILESFAGHYYMLTGEFGQGQKRPRRLPACAALWYNVDNTRKAARGAAEKRKEAEP